jgi:hypothetical protein
MMTMTLAPAYMKTPAVAARLGVAYCRLFGLLRYGVIPAPQMRDSSNHHLWSEDEIEVARAAIERLDARRGKKAPAVAA